jgi:hypothetical protein
MHLRLVRNDAQAQMERARGYREDDEPTSEGPEDAS